MLVAAVVRHPVDHHLDTAFVCCRHHPIKRGQIAENRFDVAVIAYVVAEVFHRRRVDGRQPDRVKAHVANVVKSGRNAVQVAYAVAVAVFEAARVDLVHHAMFPPGGSLCCQGLAPFSGGYFTSRSYIDLPEYAARMSSISLFTASSTRRRASSASNHACVRRMPSRNGITAWNSGTKALILLLS